MSMHACMHACKPVLFVIILTTCALLKHIERRRPFLTCFSVKFTSAIVSYRIGSTHFISSLWTRCIWTHTAFSSRIVQLSSKITLHWLCSKEVYWLHKLYSRSFLWTITTLTIKFRYEKIISTEGILIQTM